MGIRIQSSPVIWILAEIAVLSFAFAGKKEKAGRKRLFLLPVIYLSVLLLDSALVDVSTPSTGLESPLCIAGGIAIFRFVWNEDWKASVFCGVCSFFCAELLTQIMIPVTFRLIPVQPDSSLYLAVMIPVFAVLTAAVYILLQRQILPRLIPDGTFHVTGRKLVYCLLILALYLTVGNYEFIVWLMGYSPSSASRLITVFRVVLCCVCISLLFLQGSMEAAVTAEKELAMKDRLWAEKQNQYALSQENISLINRKCHDLKHQMEAIRRIRDQKEIDQQMEEMEKAVMIYDSAFRTGDDTLDTILTEKKLLCEDRGITMTCMAQGQSLSFMHQVDLYTMMGNALDNAIESVTGLADPEKRIIQIAVYTEQNFLMIRVRNYFEGSLQFEGGLPVTTKGDRAYHGFGLRSIRSTAEKYGGTAAVHTEGNYFTLQILIPQK